MEIVGTGIPVIRGEFAPSSCERIDARTFDGGHVILRYIRS
ncbi:MAG TPA: hypothetical protein VH969_01040 [Actinophytocola sp.]